MSPKCTISLPTGAILTAFKGSPPKVSGVSEDSPCHGLIKIGFTFIELTLGDGSQLTGVDTYELVAALNENAADPGRKITFEMTLPQSSTVTLAPGPAGLVIEEVHGKSTITKIEAFSPLKKELRIGMVVDKVVCEDGYEIQGGTSQEYNDLLDSSMTDPKRTIMLISPEVEPSPRKITLPKGTKVELPPGTCIDLGVSFMGTDSAKIQNVKPNSSVRGLRPGYNVHSLELAEGHSFIGLDGSALTHALDKTADSEGRIIYLKNPEFYQPPPEAVTKVMLPSDSNMQDIGLETRGSPARITKVTDGPMFGLLQTGYFIRTFGWMDGTSFSNLSTNELSEVMEDSVGLEGRYMICAYGKAPPSSAVTLTLPAGSLGAIFKGSPPALTRIKEGSCLGGEVEVGYVADTLTLPNGIKYYQMDTMEFTSALKSNADSEGRVIRFVDPSVHALTPKPYGDSSGAEMVDYKSVALPTGALGVTFKGKKRAHVSRVKPDSKLYSSLPVGMGVDTITVNSRVFMEMNSVEVADLVKSTSATPGRVMVVRNPDSNDYQKIPEKLEVVLPPGKLYCTFSSNPPVAKSFKAESPVSGYFPPAMYVDKLMMPDGYVQSGFNTRELVALLGFTSGEEGRTLVLKKKTVARSPKEELFPEEKTVELGTGKLGVSFKGKRNAYISRVHESSTLGGRAWVGMLVNSIIIPGNTAFSGMTAKEAARVLVETSNVGGRKLVLKAPGSALDARNIPDDASIAGSSQDMSAGFSTGTGLSGQSRRI
mmetsp:Transcript_6123/g.8958  ORF Transcript_6123/g.8958 Transcript_6123/m.8958 type:complete len:766 (+) Transcript_6123:37-2334(+)